MPYKIVFKEVEIHCDSPDEARDIALALVGSQSDRITSPRPPRRSQSVLMTGVVGDEGVWTTERFRSFIRLLYGNTEKLVKALVEQPEGRTDEFLRTLLGLNDNRALAGVTAGVTKNAKIFGMTGTDVFTSEWNAGDEKGNYLYRIVPSFLLACHENGWPE